MKVASALAAVVSLPLALLLDCGGRTALTPDYSVAGGGTLGLGAGGASHAGSSAVGGASHAGSSAVGGHGGMTGGAGATSNACSEPENAGPCDGAFTKYWHDANTGACIPFIYGGCEGNDNRFDTLAACQTACNSGPGAIDACTRNSDCVLEAACACVSCHPTTLDYISINLDGASSNRYQRPECSGVSCAPCPPSPSGQDESVYIVPTCANGHCAPVDLRQTDALKCAVPSDCELRTDSTCCGSCSGSQRLLAVNHQHGLEFLVCPTPYGCANCSSDIPAGYSATCTNQQCAVVPLPLR